MLILHSHWFSLLSALLLGLIGGSFLGVVAARLPRMIAQPDSIHIFNLAWPRSHCLHCQHALSWRDLMPLISYCWQRGRCRYCQHPIGISNFYWESSTATLALIAVTFYGWTLFALALVLFFSILSVIAWLDARTLLIPDVCSLGLLWLGLLFNQFELFTTLPEALWGATAGYLSLWLLYWGYWSWRKIEGLGYGDFKLLAAIGAWLGVSALPLVLLLAASAGILFALYQYWRARWHWQQAFAFGPFLCAAAGLLMLLQLVTLNRFAFIGS